MDPSKKPLTYEDGVKKGMEVHSRFLKHTLADMVERKQMSDAEMNLIIMRVEDRLNRTP